MLLWVMLALVVLLAFRGREGMTLPGAKQEPDTSKDPEPYPQGAKDCATYEKDMKATAHNLDYYYCRGFNGHTCGQIDPAKPSTPCPVGYAMKSALERQRMVESDPVAKKEEKGILG